MVTDKKHIPLIIIVFVYSNFAFFVRQPQILHNKFLALLLARLMGQYCFARCSLSSSVTLPATGRVGGQLPPGRTPAAWAVGRPTLHGGPVRLSPVRATSCFYTVLLHS